MTILVTSAAQELYIQFVLQALAYPKGYVMSDIPYELGRVDADQDEQLIGKRAVIVLLDYKQSSVHAQKMQVSSSRAELAMSVFFPLRLAEILKVYRRAGK